MKILKEYLQFFTKSKEIRVGGNYPEVTILDYGKAQIQEAIYFFQI